LLRDPQYSLIARLGKPARVQEAAGAIMRLLWKGNGRFALEGAQSYDVFKSTTERILARRGDD